MTLKNPQVIEVLLNIGDFVSVSTYLALVVVWVETFQHVSACTCLHAHTHTITKPHPHTHSREDTTIQSVHRIDHGWSHTLSSMEHCKSPLHAH